MEANPWAVAVFVISSYVLLQYEWMNPMLWGLFFVVFVLVWLAVGYLSDFIRYRNQEANTPGPTSSTPVGGDS